jgi:hypothetical protein
MSSDLSTGGGTVDLAQIFRDRVMDTLKKQFMDLIPKDVFDAMVNKQLEEFLNGPRHKRFKKGQEYVGGKYVEVEVPIPECTYRPEDDPNTLPGMIKTEVVTQFKKVAADYIQHLNYTEQIMPHVQSIDNVIAKTIRENTENFVTAMFQNVVGVAMSGTIGYLNNTTVNVQDFNQNGCPSSPHSSKFCIPQLPFYSFKFAPPYKYGSYNSF